MATALPSAFSFEMLSRLPANSFVAEWREFRPDTMPVGGHYNLVGDSASQRTRFHLRGAPNEFLLNTDVYLSGSAIGLLKTDAGVLPPFQQGTMRDIQASGSSVAWNSPFHFFRASRESFNSDSLPWHDNQDQVLSHEVNQLRYMLARRARRGDNGYDLEDLTDSFACKWQGVRQDNLTTLFDENGFPIITSTCYPSGRGWIMVDDDDNLITNSGIKHFNIPLGLYSNMINSHSVIPIGLMSSYSVNGYSISIDTQQVSQMPSPSPIYNTQVLNVRNLITKGVTHNAKSVEARIQNLRIYGLVIKILDPSVMSSILSLYEKQEQVNVGGVSFPLSLRMNSIAFRTFRYKVNAGLNHFRLPGTDRSVRAVAWRLFRPAYTRLGIWSPESDCRVVRLETRIGTDLPHPVVEDENPVQENVNNFLRANDKKSGALFSPLPYYQECRKRDCSQMDVLSQMNNTSYHSWDNQYNNLQEAPQTFGVISLENLDRREADYSGSFQASGRDLTNVGAIDIFMTFKQASLSTGNVPSLDAAVASLNYSESIVGISEMEAVFMYAYDSVMEISPAGVMDVTNAVL